MERPPSSGRFAPRVSRALIPRDGTDPATPPALTVGGEVVPNPDVNPEPPAPGYFTAARFPGWPEVWDMPWMETTPTFSTFFGYGQDDPHGWAERVVTVGTCVDLNSRTMAGFAAYSVAAGVPGDLPEWYRSSPEPSTFADWTEFVNAAAGDYFTHGEAILWALDRYANGYPSLFTLLDPQRFTIDEAGRYWYASPGGRGDLQLDPGDVRQIRYKLNRDTLRGISPLSWAGRNLVSADVLEQYALNIARHGTSAVLIAPGELTDAQGDDIRQDWSRKRAGNPGTPAVLSGGLTYSPLSLSPRDMALLDLKLFDLQMIAAAFGTPPGLVALPQAAGGLAYSSPDMLADQHWRATLLPHCQRFAGAMSNWLLPRGTRLEFNPDRYNQPALPERANAYATLHGIADPDGTLAMSAAEVRVAERFAPWQADAAHADSLVGSTRG